MHNTKGGMHIKKLIGLCCILVLLIASILVIHFSSRKEAVQSNPAPIPQTTVSLVIDPNISSTPTPAPPEPGVAIPGWGSIYLPANSLEADADLFNPEANADWYYLTFQLRLKETNDVIFQTGLIPPGKYCTKVTLTHTLAPGNYNGIMHVQPYYIKDPPTPTNNANFEIQIIVQ